jgi:thiol:disulfide interchange protein DsbD
MPRARRLARWTTEVTGSTMNLLKRGLQSPAGLRAAWTFALALLVPWPAQAANDFLPSEEAFRISAQAPDAKTVEVRFEIAPGYYMYRERFGFEAAQGATVAAAVPPGKVKYDTTFEKNVETYRDAVVVPVAVSGATGEFKLSVTSQGCADKGLCYPPRTDEFKIETVGGAISRVALLAADPSAPWGGGSVVATGGSPAEAAATPAAATQAPAAAEPAAAKKSSGSVESALQSGSLLSVMAVFAVAGVLLSFTPCVLPMVPILSSIIVGQGAGVSRLRGFTLAVSYSLGMALVYTIFGVVAGLLGEGLAAALQNPWVLGAFALLLAGLSLSMFGFYELQMPSFIQSKVTETSSRMAGGRLAGVFAMGGLSALIVGPCVAAPLAGALVYISQTKDVVIGGVALFSLACGMSVPLLLVGVSAGSLLPRAGAWMESVKRFFGVLLLGVAVWLVSPVLPGVAVMLMWGALLLICAVYLHVFDRLPDGARGWQRLFKGVGVLMAIVGVAQVTGALSGGTDAMQPLAHLAAGGSRAAVAAGNGNEAHGGVAFRRVKTVAELDAVVKAAGKPVMLDFYADWCVSCKEYERFTFRAPKVREKLDNMVLLQVDVTANTPDDKALLKRFGLFGPPGIVFFDAQGQELSDSRVIGYEPSDQFLQSLQEAGV